MVKVSLKSIKPKASSMDVDKIRRVVREALEETSELVLQDYVATTATWNNKPSFQRNPTADGVDVYTDSEIYEWIDKGTPPHDIAPVRTTRLRFGVNSGPKTTPGNIMSGAGRAGSPIVFARRVRHPGIRPRLFTKIINKKRNKELSKRITAGLKRL